MPPTAPPSAHLSPRTRRDRCPGVLRPWPADDGALVRIRVVGQLSSVQLTGLAALASSYGDGELHLTSRANLQLRAVAYGEAFVAEVERLGLLPSRRHDLARNVVVSPLSGRVGGRLDARPLAAELDALIRGDDRLGDLPGRFLFTLDDGRGDLADLPTDLGLVALDASTVQLRVGTGWGEVVAADAAPRALADLAQEFLDVRGDGPDAPWHVTELPAPLVTPQDAEGEPTGDPALPDGPARLDVPDGVMTPDLVARATADGGPVVVTPWHALVVTDALR